MGRSDLHFCEEDWRRVERDTMAWWEGELGRPLVMLTAVSPAAESPLYRFLGNYPLDMPVDEIIAAHEPALAATRYYGDALPWW